MYKSHASAMKDVKRAPVPMTRPPTASVIRGPKRSERNPIKKDATPHIRYDKEKAPERKPLSHDHSFSQNLKNTLKEYRTPKAVVVTVKDTNVISQP
jgi:hypothetical protein